jgi:hypothetical protein
MAHRNILIVSGILRHAVGVILLCWVRAARAAGIAGLIGFVITEIAATALTHHFPATGVSHLVALALGVALAYAAGVTVFADELILGITDAVQLLMGEAEAGARAAAILVEREAGMGLAPLLRRAGLAPAVSGLRAGEGSRALASLATRWAQRDEDSDDRGSEEPAHASAPARRARRPSDSATSETLAALAPETEPIAQPLPPVLGRPVPADRLPRIGWMEERSAPRVDPIATRAAPPQAPAPITRPLLPEMNPAPGSPASSALGAAAGSGAEAATPRLAEPQVWHADDAPPLTPATWHDPLWGAEDDEEESGIRPVDAFGGPQPAAITQPLPEHTPPLSEQATPLAREAQPSGPRGSVWDHISQVLAGRPVEPLPEEDAEEPPAEAAPPESEPPSE